MTANLRVGRVDRNGCQIRLDGFAQRTHEMLNQSVLVAGLEAVDIGLDGFLVGRGSFFQVAAIFVNRTDAQVGTGQTRVVLERQAKGIQGGVLQALAEVALRNDELIVGPLLTDFTLALTASCENNSNGEYHSDTLPEFA